MVRSVLIFSVVLVVLAGGITWLVDAYLMAEGIRLGPHGILATFLCLVFVPGITFGLMFLVRLSRDRGFDDRADTWVRDQDHDDGAR